MYLSYTVKLLFFVLIIIFSFCFSSFYIKLLLAQAHQVLCMYYLRKTMRSLLKLMTMSILCYILKMVELQKLTCKQSPEPHYKYRIMLLKIYNTFPILKIKNSQLKFFVFYYYYTFIGKCP